MNYSLMKKLYGELEDQLLFTIKNRIITLVLLSIFLTPLAVFAISNYIPDIKTLILLSILTGLPLLCHLYHKDDTLELEGVYIDIKTIRKVRRLRKEYKK